MAELVRVARDSSAIIVRTDDDLYIRTSSDGTGERETATRISVLTAGGGWRRVTSEDQENYAAATIVAAGKVFVEDNEPKTKIYRVPPTVQKSIQSALEAYAPILSDKDREVAGRLSSQTQVSRDDIEWMHSFFENIEKALALHGGRRGQTWARKVLADESLVAGAAPRHAAFDEEDALFVAGTDETLYDTLYMVDPTDGSVYVWENSDFSALDLKDGEIEREQLQEIDADTAQLLSLSLDAGNATTLADLIPEERNLFDLAEAEMDFEYMSLLADATGYSPAERSVNAQRQRRGPGGKFGEGSPAPVGQKTEAFAKARLPEGTPLLEDPAARINEYLGSTPEPEEAPRTSSSPMTAAGEESEVEEATSERAPLYLAIVDATDKTAVLDVISIISDGEGNATGWRREGSKWVADNDIVPDLRGDTPPPLVELSDEGLLKETLAQVDQSDGEAPERETVPEDVMQASAFECSEIDAKEREKLAGKGYSLPDGSYPIRNVSDLKNAISAYGRAKDKTAARKHIRKRARALNRADLIPDSWKGLAAEEPVTTAELFGPFGEVLVASGVPGVADTPEDFRNVARLKRYWAFGPGAAKIRWGTPGDLTRAHRQLSKYVGSKDAWGLAQNIHKMVFGVPNATHDKRTGQ